MAFSYAFLCNFLGQFRATLRNSLSKRDICAFGDQCLYENAYFAIFSGPIQFSNADGVRALVAQVARGPQVPEHRGVGLPQRGGSGRRVHPSACGWLDGIRKFQCRRGAQADERAVRAAARKRRWRMVVQRATSVEIPDDWQVAS